MSEMKENYEYVKNLIEGYATQKDLPFNEVESRVQSNIATDTEPLDKGTFITVNGEKEFIAAAEFADYLAAKESN